MFLHNDIKAALNADEFRRHLPELYPKSYSIFMMHGAADGRAPNFTNVQGRIATATTTAARLLDSTEEHGVVSIPMSTRDRRVKRATMAQTRKRVPGERMRQFAERSTKKRKHVDSQTS